MGPEDQENIGHDGHEECEAEIHRLKDLAEQAVGERATLMKEGDVLRGERNAAHAQLHGLEAENRALKSVIMSVSRVMANWAEILSDGKPKKTKRYVYLPQDVRGDGPFAHHVARSGVYERHENQHGAVSVMVSDNEGWFMLGVKPAEFVDAGGVIE